MRYAAAEQLPAILPSTPARRRMHGDIRVGRCYLSDLRAGPARDVPDFEQAIFKLMPRVHAGFVRSAVLVRMAVGALQIQRHARQDGFARLGTTNAEEAPHDHRTGSPLSAAR